MRAEGLAFPEAVERLAAAAGLEVPVASPEERETERRRAGLLDATEAAARFYEARLWERDGAPALAYLRDRGLDDDTIRRFRLGWAPAGNALRGALMSAEMPETLLLEAGLVRRPDDGRSPYDFFRERVLFPIADARGRVIAFGGRTLGDGEPKYLNSPDTPLFDKRRTLYGLAAARRAAHERGRVLVVEGYMDVIALSQAGLAETVAPLGTALTEDHLRLLWRLAPEPVLCLDGDAAGSRAAGRAAERALPLLEPEKSLRFVTLPAGEDPDSLVRAAGAAAIEELIARATPLDEVIWGLETAGRPADTPERRAGLEQRLDDRALSIADRKVQNQYRDAFRQRLRALTRPARGAAGAPFRRGGTGGTGNWGGGWTDGGRSGGGRADAGGFARAGHAAGQGAPGPRAALHGAGPGMLRRRREQVLLAVVVNHPAILDAFDEDLAMVNVSDPKLDKLRQEILKVYAAHDGLDSGSLRDHLKDRGHAEVLTAVLGPDVMVHAGFARDDASEEAARAGFLEVLATYLEPGRRAELEEARHDYVANPTDENWSRFEKLKRDGRQGGAQGASG